MQSGSVSDEDFERLRACVHADAALARLLRDIAPDRFAVEVVAVAARLGLSVREEDVRERVRRGAQAWMLRWIR